MSTALRLLVHFSRAKAGLQERAVMCMRGTPQECKKGRKKMHAGGNRLGGEKILPKSTKSKTCAARKPGRNARTD